MDLVNCALTLGRRCMRREIKPCSSERRKIIENEYEIEKQTVLKSNRMAIFRNNQLPEKFHFRRQEEWPKWSRRFERFRQASGVAKEQEESQINILICAMGDQADDILNSFKLSTTQLKQYHTVKTKFDDHFVVRRNVIFQRAKFNLRRQEEGETVDTLSQHCMRSPNTVILVL